MKIISIVGARPQFIKLAPFSTQIRKHFEEIIIHTGQHFDDEMSQIFFDELKIPRPDFNLGISGGNHGEQTGKMLIALEEILLKEQPSVVIVFGDTNTTLAGAIAAAKLGIKTIHVEAGLRSFNRTMPEELNRIITDHTCDYLFAPTQTGMDNLKIENLSNKSFLTGDIMVDSLKMATENIANTQCTPRNYPYYLLTLHRPYNVDNSYILSGIIHELGNLQQKVIFPVHPRTNKIIITNNIYVPENIEIIQPVSYLEFVALQLNSLKVITDSGGIQKEAYILKKPCITLRSETEWIETVRSGWNLLINPNTKINYSKNIESFNPNGNYYPIFGQDVAKKMNAVIENILL